MTALSLLDWRERVETIAAPADKSRISHGDVVAASERFWSYVDRGGDECWHWLLRLNGRGYGVFKIRSHPFSAHRISWWLSNGRAPSGPVLHSCDNPRCVRPEHLSVGTIAENNRQCASRGRRANSRLDAGKVAEVVARIRAGESDGDISAAYGVGTRQINNIRNGWCWSHVTGIPSKRAPMARLVMQREPDLAGVFETRARKSVG